MRYALTFAIGCPFKNTIVVIEAKDQFNASIYAKAVFGHIWAGIYDAYTFMFTNKHTVIEETITAEEGIRRACNNNWICASEVPQSIWNPED